MYVFRSVPLLTRVNTTLSWLDLTKDKRYVCKQSYARVYTLKLM